MGQQKFATTSSKDSLPLLVSGYKQDAEQALFIHQDARIYGGKVTAGSKITLPIIHQAYVLASSGSFTIFDEQGQAINLHQGDGAEVTAQSRLKIEATAEAEIIVIDAP